MKKYFSVLKEKNFALFWLGLLISNFGDIFTYLSLTWLILEINGSAFSLGLTLLAYELPPVFMAPIAGYYLDQYRVEKVIIVESLLRALFISAIPITYKLNILNLWILMLLIALSSGLSAISRAGNNIMIPHLISSENLVTANSLKSIQYRIARLIAPAVAGILIDIIGSANLMFVDSATFLLIAFIFYLIMVNSKRFVPDIEKKDNIMNIWKNNREGLAYIYKNKALLIIIFIFFIWNFTLWGTLAVGFPVFIKQELLLGAKNLGLIMSLSSGALLIGSFIIGAVEWKVNLGKVLVGIIMIHGLLYIGVGLSSNILQMAVFVVLAGLILSPVDILYSTFLQTSVPEKLQGRVFSICGSASVVGESSGLVVAGFLVGLFGAGKMIVISALCAVLCGFVFIWHPTIRMENKVYKDVTVQ
ncbi:hypothetical protein BBF96_10215 [Anoxybacter fermentans]|uniref:Major facilitator superfamily (MFS) profile domain-containing protein n=1 Tax=Anoxybacter fermentans TaxID=1323375 RepID=A0A3Q9HR69_9FIRM|nr:MFS transporter [Anoxybacter fermentans]AZR73725.1 hypothetical protein BBF96_10215 [Anoxybacter fermentans]